MAAKRYSIYSSTITDGATPLNLTQVRGTTISSGSRKREIVPGGAVDRGAVILSHADATARIETADLATALGAVSPTTGYNATSGATFRAQQRSAGGVFVSGSNHVTIASGKGFLIPERLSASQDDENGAMLSLLYYALSSTGLADPLTFAAAQALANSPAFVSQYFLGPVYYDSSQLDGVLSSECEFGIGYAPKRHDGAVFPAEGSIIGRMPVFRISLDELDHIATIGDMFNASLGGTFAMYFRKGAPGGSRVADATEEHIKVSCTAGVWSPSDVSGQAAEADYAAAIEIIPTGTISVSTTSAIP